MQKRYIVVEPSLIVAQDLAHAIRAFDPTADVQVLSQAADVLAAVAEEKPTVVFLHREPSGDQSIRVGHALGAAGIPVAFTGAEVEAWPEGAEVLASPFSEVTVARLLQRLLGRDLG